MSTTTNQPPWDPFRAELADTMRSTSYARPKRPCIYCDAMTRALSQVCCAHSDLPALDPGAKQSEAD